MILNVERDLMDRGFPEFHVKKELYWPKGKDAARSAAERRRRRPLGRRRDRRRTEPGPRGRGRWPHTGGHGPART